jgi:hypothetical protein
VNAAFLRTVVCAVLAAQLAACGGSPASQSAAASFVPGAHLASKPTKLVLRLNVHRHRRHRRPHYVSPSMQSFVYVVEGPSPSSTAIAGGAVNFTPNSAACTQSGALQPLVCTETLPIRLPQSGTYTIAAATYDAAQNCGGSGVCSTAPCTPGALALPCSGNQLSNQTVTQQLVIGRANTVTLTMGADVAGTIVTPLPASGATANFLRGDAEGLSLWGPSTQQIAVEAVDAGGNPVVGPGAPAITVTSANAAQLAVTPVTGSPGIFAIHAVTTGSAAGPIVQPGFVNLSIELSAPASGGGSLPAVNPRSVPANVQHAAVWVSGSPGTEVLGFFDGNGSPSVTLSGSATTLSEVTGVSADAMGNLYVYDSNDHQLLQFPAGSNGNVAPSRATLLLGANSDIVAIQATSTDDGTVVLGGADPPGGYYIGFVSATQAASLQDSSGTNSNHGVTVGRCGDVITDGTGGQINAAYDIRIADLCTSPIPANDIVSLAPTLNGNDYGIAVDTNYDFFFSATHLNAIYEYDLAGTQLEAVQGTNTGLSSPWGIALDAAGSMYVANVGANTVTAYAAGSNGNAAPIATIGIPFTPTRLAVQPQNIHI